MNSSGVLAADIGTPAISGWTPAVGITASGFLADGVAQEANSKLMHNPGINNRKGVM